MACCNVLPSPQQQHAATPRHTLGSLRLPSSPAAVAHHSSRSRVRALPSARSAFAFARGCSCAGVSLGGGGKTAVASCAQPHRFATPAQQLSSSEGRFEKSCRRWSRGQTRTRCMGGIRSHQHEGSSDPLISSHPPSSSLAPHPTLYSSLSSSSPALQHPLASPSTPSSPSSSVPLSSAPPASSFGGTVRTVEREGGEASEHNDYSSSSSAVAVAELEVVVEAEELSVDLSEEEFKERWSRRPKRIAIFVEPSPFDYVCGYKNRYQNFIRYLREGGDEVLVITTHKGAPKDFCGARVVPSWSFPFPFYPLLPLSLALSPRIFNEVKQFDPDLIHSSSPGVMCFGALVIGKLLNKPLVFSYHTHVPAYIPKYTFSFLVAPMWALIRFVHLLGDLTLVTSQQLGQELLEFKATAADRVCVWRKGVDSEAFHPRFRNQDTRHRLSGGEVDKPLLVHVGRLGAEKNLALLRPLLDRMPGVRLAFVGDGPYRPELEALFEGTPTVFTGMLSGTDLSEAYASGDIFLMPSETETLGFVVLEAMASGLPVVAARAGGIPDIVSCDGETGFLFTPGDVDEAVAKVQALIDSPELRRRVGQAARADVERFDWRAATRSVRHDHYGSAVWLWEQERERKRRRRLEGFGAALAQAWALAVAKVAAMMGGRKPEEEKGPLLQGGSAAPAL